MDIERLKELKAEFEKVRKYNDMHCMSTVTEDDVLELIDEAITNQPVTKSATSEDVGMVIKLMQAYGKNITSKCQIEGTIFYDTGSPCVRHRFGEDTIDTIITALQAYQPTISKTETTSCCYCRGIESHGIVAVKTVIDEYLRVIPAYDTPYSYCPNCGRKIKED